MGMPNETRKRPSSAFEDYNDVITLDDDEVFPVVHEDDEDDEDLNYAASKRKSIVLNQSSKVQSSVICNRTRSSTSKALDNAATEKEELFSKKQYLSSRIDRICDYAQVLMHCLLYKINYYNKKTHFDKYIKYNIIVYKCKSEIVCEYITNCIESMRLILYEQNNLNNSEPIPTENQSLFSIGLAVLKSVNSSESTGVNLLIKRYILQVESAQAILNDSDDSDSDANESIEVNSDDDLNDFEQEISITNKQEWEFRDSLLKCLYSQDTQYPSNFKWQIQLRTTKKKMNEISRKEDLFKLFAWRQCDSEEVTSVTSRKSSDLTSVNKISVRPIKTIEHLNKKSNIKIQLFVEQPLISNTHKSPIKSSQRLARNKKLSRRSGSLSRDDSY